MIKANPNKFRFSIILLIILFLFSKNIYSEQKYFLKNGISWNSFTDIEKMGSLSALLNKIEFIKNNIDATQLDYNEPKKFYLKKLNKFYSVSANKLIPLPYSLSYIQMKINDIPISTIREKIISIRKEMQENPKEKVEDYFFTDKNKIRKFYRLDKRTNANKLFFKITSSGIMNIRGKQVILITKNIFNGYTTNRSILVRTIYSVKKNTIYYRETQSKMTGIIKSPFPVPFLKIPSNKNKSVSWHNTRDKNDNEDYTVKFITNNIIKVTKISTTYKGFYSKSISYYKKHIGLIKSDLYNKKGKLKKALCYFLESYNAE